MDGSSLSTLVQMVGAGIGITLIPEMAVAVETRSASVSTVRFQSPQPSRTIGMIWRRTSPLAKQLMQISEVVREAADTMREQHDSIWRVQDLEFDGRQKPKASQPAFKGASFGAADDSAPGS
jgi:LysR family hydrogen peroxide-inducible transcriptional activator